MLKTTDNTPYEKIGDEVRSLADEVPFDIPDSWEWVRISSIAALVTKGTTPRGGNVAYSDNGIGFLRAENVAGLDRLDLSKLNHIDEATHTGFLKRSILEADDVLITIAGTLGRTAIVKEENLPLNANQAVAIIRLADSHSVDLRYLVYALNAPTIQDKLTAQKKITAIPNLTLEIISDCLVPIPPLNEQKRIVNQFALFVPQIAEYEDKQTELYALNTGFPEALKKSILQEAVQGKLVPQDPSDEPAEALLERIRVEKQRLIKEGIIKKDKHESVIFRRDNSHYEKCGSEELCIDEEIPFEIPDNWAWARLSSFGVFSSGKTPSMSNPQFWNGDVSWVTSKDMKHPVIMDSEMHITEQAAATMQLYPAGTLLLVARSGILKRLLPLCTLGVDSTINQDIKAFSLYDIELSEWLFYGIKAFEPYILKKLVKSVTTVESLKFDEFAAMLIPVPPLSEQRRIIAAIRAAMKLLTPLSSNPLFSL